MSTNNIKKISFKQYLMSFAFILITTLSNASNINSIIGIPPAFDNTGQLSPHIK